MEPRTEQPVESQSAAEEAGDSLTEQIRIWIRGQLPWWTMSFSIHVVALASLLLVGKFALPAAHDEIPTFTPPDAVAEANQPLKPFEFPQTDIQPPEINPDAPPQITGSTAPDAVPSDGRLSGDPGGDPAGNPPPLGSPTGIGVVGSPGFGPGPQTNSVNPFGDPRHSNPGKPYDKRNLFGPRIIGSTDGQSRGSDRAVLAAIYWLSNHQSRDGSWSLQEYVKMCHDKTCTGVGGQESLSAATAMGVLPFLGAGVTHVVGPPKYQKNVFNAVYWLISHQKLDGDLSAGASQQMYSHALATIALCEDYGMSQDKLVKSAAQKGIDFIVAAQNSKTGGWRYHPGDDGDTSVTGWQLMALKSGQMAKLNVNPAAFDGVKRWLTTVAKDAPAGSSGGSGQFSYQPEGASTPTMSAVGLLCSQYMHAGRADPTIVGGVKYLMANMPATESQNVYYWYYATQVMHNMNDKDWDAWNQRMRPMLVASQAHNGCAAGSWDPDKPVRDAWGVQGGRVMMTSLSALTLEVYYRNLPLYKLDKPESLDQPVAK